ncbi:uncharacterized protein LOC143877459 [Tasmannia lanceolata]|uniref:uncharacterized protein LOC143877459 n=1 Tax=Tasmannia lanceolata TaxID=3420 RepID=UPI004063251E
MLLLAPPLDVTPSNANRCDEDGYNVVTRAHVTANSEKEQNTKRFEGRQMLWTEGKYGVLPGNWYSQDNYRISNLTIWTEIMKQMNMFQEDFRYRVNKGDKVRFWHGIWCMESALRNILHVFFRVINIKKHGSNIALGGKMAA